MQLDGLDIQYAGEVNTNLKIESTHFHHTSGIGSGLTFVPIEISKLEMPQASLQRLITEWLNEKVWWCFFAACVRGLYNSKGWSSSNHLQLVYIE